ncbi:MAG: two-component system response regulator [Planctomycetes bacterium RBG_13_63_9]|nr:MAG: two-component system response regulator [Planctomycetes bacterium RBG_13_63_9]
MPHEKVLLVDDEREFTEVLSQRMQSRGVAVETAGNGREALQKVQSGSYDAIFLDLAMPGMDGIETLKHLLNVNPDLQVILLTGYASVQKGVEAVKLGAMDFLEKPAEIQKLMDKIHQAKANRMVIVERQAEEKIKGILDAKGW